MINDKQEGRQAESTGVLTDEIQRLILRDGKVEALRLLAGCAGLSEEVQSVLGASEDQLVREALAANLYLRQKTLLKLARDKAFAVRWQVAFNPSLNLDVQRLLAVDGVKQVRSALAANEAIFSDIQVVLAGDNEESVRRSLASNRSIAKSFEAQNLLVHDVSSEVRQALARNLSVLASEIQALLVKDKDFEVRKSFVESRSVCPPRAMSRSLWLALRANEV